MLSKIDQIDKMRALQNQFLPLGCLQSVFATLHF